MENVKVFLEEHVPNYMDARSGSFKLRFSNSDMFDEKYLIIYGREEPICLMVIDKYVFTPGQQDVLVHVSYFGCFPKGTDFTELKQGNGRFSYRIFCDITAMLQKLGAGSVNLKSGDIFDPQSPSDAKRRVGLMFGVTPDRVNISVDF